MGRLSYIHPDIALASFLNGKIKVRTSARSSHVINVYGEGEKPNKGIGDEFVEITWNGSASRMAHSLYKGYLMLSVYVRTQTDGRAKKKIINQILSQLGGFEKGVQCSGYYFALDATSVITPTTVNLTTGFSTTVLNVSWHVTDDFIND